MPRRLGTLVMGMVVAALLGACSPRISLLPSPDAPLRESTLQGRGPDKILVIPISGEIEDQGRGGLFGARPSLVEQVSLALEKARRDKAVKAVLLRIDSPGGGVTASDVLYHEILRFKKETGVKVVAQLGDVAASGGYYLALAADHIIAHPTSVTGSIGVIFFTADVNGLLHKIGVSVEPVKSGTHKDIGSPFRPMTDEERALLQGMIDEMYTTFVRVVATRPGLDEAKVRALADGRVWTASQARELGLIDEIGYTPDALARVRTLAGLKKDVRVVVYRREVPLHDTIYNGRVESGVPSVKLLDLGFESALRTPRTGFYYLWQPAGE